MHERYEVVYLIYFRIISEVVFLTATDDLMSCLFQVAALYFSHAGFNIL